MSNDVTEHQLLHFVKRIQSEMADDYQYIRKEHSREDPNVAGSNGEKNWVELFRKWLPKQLQYATNVRIIGLDGNKTREADIVILEPGYPSALAEKNEILSAGVVAAFECKLTLRKADFQSTLAKTPSIKSTSHTRSLGNALNNEIHSGLSYYLLAHDHDLGSLNSAYSIYREHLFGHKIGHPRGLLDGVYIASGSWCETRTLVKGDLKSVQRGVRALPEPRIQFSETLLRSEYVQTHLVENDGNPIGQLLITLLRELAGRGINSPDLARYFSSAVGKGSEGVSFSWPPVTFSEEAQEYMKTQLN